MAAITAVLAAIGAWLTGMLGFVIESVEGMVPLFWDGTALTVIGALALMGLGIGLVKLGIHFVMKFFVK